nr:ribonuclease H-like domain-containing protein [Tanacetum cinerariifolium]
EACELCNTSHTFSRFFGIGGKPPKDKGKAFGFEENSIDQYDHMFLHSNGTRDESHRSTQSHNVSKSGSAAFVAKTNNINNNWSGSNNQPRRLNRPNLVCTRCNMIGHTADRCFKLVGYPPNFKIKILIIYAGASQHMTYTIINMFNIDDVSKLNMTVGHPNGTKALVTHVGSLKLTDKIVIHNVLVAPGYQVSLLSVHSLGNDNKFRVIFYEDTYVIQDSALRTQV